MKLRLLLMAVVALFLTVSCSGNKSTSSDNAAEANTEQEIKSNNNKMAKTINLTREDFLAKVANIEANPQEWKYLGDKPCLIDFYADWCGPCKMVAPILEELAGEYADDLYIYKVDTEVEQQLAAEFGIRSIPSLLFVPMEGQPQMAQGALPKDALKEAAKVLIYHFMMFSDEKITLENTDGEGNEEFDEEVLHMRQLLKTKLVDMDLSVRALNCLKAAEVETLGHLVTHNKNDLLKFRNFGKKSLTELEVLLEGLNLTFGMDISKYKLDKD